MAGNPAGPGFPITDYNESHVTKIVTYTFICLSDLFIFAGSNTPGIGTNEDGRVSASIFRDFLTMSMLPQIP